MLDAGDVAQHCCYHLGAHAKCCIAVFFVVVGDFIGRYWLCTAPSELTHVARAGVQFFHEAILSDWDCIYKLVSDDQEVIEAAIKDLVRFIRVIVSS